MTERDRRLLQQLYKAMLEIRRTRAPSTAQTSRFLRIRDELCQTVEGSELFRAVCPGS